MQEHRINIKLYILDLILNRNSYEIVDGIKGTIVTEISSVKNVSKEQMTVTMSSNAKMNTL